MPKNFINDYIFYKIVCLNDDISLCYVGATANWKQRQKKHKGACNNENNKEYNQKKYEIIRANGGWSNFKMVQIGTREQLTKRESEQVEEEYRVELKANMNMKRCYITEEQKKEHRKQRNKEYNENNKQALTEYKKEYRENNKEKIKEYRENNKEDLLKKKREYDLKNREKNKEYYENNKEKINEQKKEYRKKNKEYFKEKDKKKYENNKEQILEKAKEKVTCECGCEVTKTHLPRHKRTNKHLVLMNE
jgi:hypothetical protein